MRASAAFPTMGWCGMRIAIFNWSGAARIRPGQAKVTACEWEEGRIEIRAEPNGLAGLRFGSGPPHGMELVTKEKKRTDLTR
jgi:hypothetical protein